jgi:hypothetical protein
MPPRPGCVCRSQLEYAAQARCSAALFRPARTATGPGAFGVLRVLTLAGFVLTVAAGLVPAAFPILVPFAIPLVGSVWRLGALLAGGIVAIGSIPGTGRPGCWGVATRRAHGQHRSTCPPRRRHRRAGSGVLHDQPEGDTDEGPQQRTHRDQELASTANRSVHRASKVEHTSLGCRSPMSPNLEERVDVSTAAHRAGDGKVRPMERRSWSQVVAAAQNCPPMDGLTWGLTPIGAAHQIGVADNGLGGGAAMVALGRGGRRARGTVPTAPPRRRAAR